MTLPQTITGATLPVVRSYNGPERNSSGDHYICLPPSAVPDDTAMYKADNGDNTWSEQDSSNRPSHGSNNCISVYKGSDILHVCYQSNSSVYYSPYRMSNHASPDTWGTELIVIGTTTAAVKGCEIAVRSDGDIVVVYQASPSGGFERIRYGIHQGTNFSDATGAVDDGGSVHYTDIRLTKAASDNIYIFYKTDADNLIYKVLASDNTLSSAQTVNDTAIVTGNYSILDKPIYYDNGGTETVIVGWIKSSDSKVAISTITSGGVPGAEVTGISDATVEQATHIVAAIAIDTNTSKAYLIYADDSAQDFSVDTDLIGGGETDTSIETSITANYVSANIYQIDSGDYVLGYVYQDSTTIKYNEWTLPVAGAGGTLRVKISGENPLVI